MTSIIHRVMASGDLYRMEPVNTMKTQRYLTLLLTVLMITAGVSVCAQERRPDTAPQPAAQFPAADAQAALTYRIIDAPNGTFGYDILSDGRLFVHQTNLPGLPGNEGCRTKADAEKLATFIIEKMKKGEMPPSVTPEELKELGIH